jgi:hypothetical protein
MTRAPLPDAFLSAPGRCASWQAFNLVLLVDD